jgi:UDP-glucose 4-epimerase
MRNRVLITGGAGFVGRTLTRQLYNDFDVCVVDTLKFGLGRFRPDELAKFQLAQVDIRDAGAVSEVIEDFQPKVIIHLAAIHFIPACERDPGEANSVNVVGTANLLKACPHDCRFVFASSGAVYAPDAALHDEQDSEIGPSDVYGFTKSHGEDLVRYFAKAKNLEAVIVRLFNVVGPGETNPHLLPEIVAQMKAGIRRIQLGNLWPKRDYIHVADAAAGFAAAGLRGCVKPGQPTTVNLGTSNQYSVQEILDRLSAVSGLRLEIEVDAERVRPVDRPFLGAAIHRIEAAFGWRPQFTIDDATADLWRNPDMTAELADKYSLRRLEDVDACA